MEGSSHSETVAPIMLQRDRRVANSRGLVFVDEAAEQIGTANVGGRCRWRRIASVWREQLEGAVWPVVVVVAAVDAEHVFEMAAAKDEDPVEAVGANGAYPTLGEGVRVRRLDRRADHFDAFRPEHLVEGVAEFRVAIVDEEPERLLVTELPTALTSLPFKGTAFGKNN